MYSHPKLKQSEITFEYNNETRTLPTSEFYEFLDANNLQIDGDGNLNKVSGLGIFPMILDQLYKLRAMYKRKMLNFKKDKDEYNTTLYNSKQMAMKILLNSFYGFLAFKTSRFFDNELGEAVTLSGQKLIKKSIKTGEEHGYNVIGADTDSCLATIGEIDSVESAIMHSRKFSECVNGSLNQFSKDEFNVSNHTFSMKEELISRRGIFFQKKRYCLWIINQEGVNCDEIEYKGIDIKRNSTPPFAKKHLEFIFECALKENDKDKVYSLIQNFEEEFKTMDVNDIGIRMTMTKPFSEYKKNLPIHVRGCLLFEDFFAKQIQKSFNNESKGRYYFLKEMPGLKLGEKEMKALKKKGIVLSVPDGVEFPLSRDIIDYDRMKDRIVDKPLKALKSLYEGDSVNEEEDDDE